MGLRCMCADGDAEVVVAETGKQVRVAVGGDEAAQGRSALFVESTADPCLWQVMRFGQQCIDTTVVGTSDDDVHAVGAGQGGELVE